MILDRINADVIITFFEEFSFQILKQTVAILENARIHLATNFKKRISYWEQRGLFLFFSPPYSPHLNIIERLWKELKFKWIKTDDYTSFYNLRYAISSCLKNVGQNLRIKYSKYS